MSTPAKVLARIAASARDRRLIGLTGFSASNYLATAAGGGEPANATNWTVAALVRVDSLPTVAQQFFARSDGVGFGWTLGYQPSSGFSISSGNGGAMPVLGAAKLAASDIGRVFLVVGRRSGATLSLYTGRSLAGTLAVASYGVPTGPQTIGSLGAPGQPATSFTVLDAVTFPITLSDSEIEAMSDYARAWGAFAPVLPGVSHSWSVKRSLAGTLVTPGQTAPAQLTDRVTGAAGDALARVGAPTVRVIDPSFDGAVAYGALGFSDTAYLRTAGGTAGAAGVSFWEAVLFRVQSISAASKFRMLAARQLAGGTQGRAIQTFGTNVSLNATYGTGAAAVNTSTATLTAADVGQLLLVVSVYDAAAGMIRLYLRGVQVGSDVALASYAPFTGDLQIGKHPQTANVAADVGLDIYGYASGLGVPTLAEVQAMDLASARGRIAAIPGKTEHLYDLTLDTLAGGVSAGVPATVLDRVGTDHLSRVGTALTVAQRVERVWSYERSPIAYAFEASATARYASAGGSGFSGATWWCAALVRVRSQSVASASRSVINNDSGAFNGVSIRTTTTNALVTCVAGTGTAYVVSPSLSIGAADVGKLLLIVAVADGAKLRLFGKRAEQGTGTAYTAAIAPSAMALGATISGSQPADGVEIVGACGGGGVLSLAEVQALHDACMTAEDVQAVAGKTSWLVSVTRDSGGSVPAALTDRVGSTSLAVVGSPTLAPIYARAWAW